MVCRFLETCEPPCQKKYSGKLGNLRWLKTDWAESDPTPRAVDPHSNVRNETQNEHDRGDTDPQPPSALPEMVIDQRRRSAGSEPHSEPRRFVLEEKIRLVMAVLRKSAGAKKHHDADVEQSQHRNKGELIAFPIHLPTRPFL